MSEIEALQARIEALVKARREDALELLAAHGQAQEAYEAQLKAEARAERLEAALREIADGDDWASHDQQIARAALEPVAAPDPDDDPVCTDCGGTGITYQTERRCACQPPPDPAAIREDSPNHAYRVGYAAGRAAALRESATEARRFANIYDEGSDGRNTFNILADRILALITEKPHDRA